MPQFFISVFLKSAGTVNASGLALLVDTEINCDETVSSPTSPGGNGAADTAGAGVVAAAGALSESSFFLWNRPPSLPATAPASAAGLLAELSLSWLSCPGFWCALGSWHCAPPMASVKLLLTGYPFTPCILLAISA